MIKFESNNMPLQARTFLDPTETVDKPEAPLLDQAVSAFELENTYTSWRNDERRQMGDLEPADDYDPLSEIAGTRYESVPEIFQYSESPEETAVIRRQYDREQRAREQSDTGFGTAMKVLANIGDPVLLPFITMAPFRAGAGVIEAAATGAVVIGGTELLAEIGLRETQVSRTKEETMLRVGAAAVTAGLLGGVIAKMSPNKLDDIVTKVSDDIGAEESVVEKVIREDAERSMGAAEVKTTTLEQEEMLGAGGTAFGLTPATRLAKSKSVEARRGLQLIGETGFTTKKNVEGIATDASVETRVKRYDAFMDNAIESLDEAYLSLKNAKTSIGAAVKRGMNRRQFNREVSHALRTGDVSKIPEVEKAAKAIRRDVLDPIKRRAIDEGLLPENVSAKYADSYLSRMYNFNRIRQRPDEFRAILTRHMSGEGIDPVDVSQAVDEVMEKMTGKTSDLSGASAAHILPKADALKERVLAIPDSALEDFLENDIETILHNYVRQMSVDIEISKATNGDRNIDDLISKVRADYQKLIDAAGSERERLKLENRAQSDVDDLNAMVERLYGTYGRPENPRVWVHEVSAGLRHLNLVRMLGGMTVSAFPDVARPVMINGMAPMAQTYKLALINPKAFKMARQQMKEYAVGLDMTLNTRLQKIGDTDDVIGMRTAVGRGVKSMSDTFGLPSLMAPWNATMKQIAGIGTANRILGVVSKGNISANNITKLARSGIDQDMAAKIAEQFAKHGETVDGVRIANSKLWDDQAAADVFANAVLKDVDVAIVTPGVGDKPLWASTDIGKVALQFQGFALAAQNRIVVSGLQQRDMAILNGMVIAVGLGAMVYTTKQALRGKEVSDNPRVFLKEAIDYSGLMGWMMNPINAIDTATKGEVTELLTGEREPASRYSSRGFAGAFTGPTGGTIGDMGAAVQDIASGEADDVTVRRIRRLLPYQNLFWLRNALNALEEEVGEAVQ